MVKPVLPTLLQYPRTDCWEFCSRRDPVEQRREPNTPSISVVETWSERYVREMDFTDKVQFFNERMSRVNQRLEDKVVEKR